MGVLVQQEGKDNNGFVTDNGLTIHVTGVEADEKAMWASGACADKMNESLPGAELTEVTKEDIEVYYNKQRELEKANTIAITNIDQPTVSNPPEEDDEIPWADLTRKQKIRLTLYNLWKTLWVLVTLYFFICSLLLLSISFQILGGRTAGELFSNESILSNPFTGLILGIMATVLLQSSSTSTSIVVTMVGTGIIDVGDAIYIIMGTNIGTSVTNTIVSLTQSIDREEFRLSFAGATVHDMFNLLAVAVMFPLEIATGYLEWLSGAIVDSMDLQSTEEAGSKFLEVITDPVIDQVIQLNKTVIELIALGVELDPEDSIIKTWCEQEYVCLDSANVTIDNCTDVILVGRELCKSPQDFLFANTGMTDAAVGIICLVMSLILLCGCLLGMVKLLNSMMQGSASKIIKKIINTNFKKPFAWVSGYLAIIVGAILTVLVQSSSVFTSTMTPLVGIGVITVKRMYPLTLGANLGTTSTGLLAAFATQGDYLEEAVQIAFCHLFFNITAICVWYPVPITRTVPIGAAQKLGDLTARFRWFAVLYLILFFFVIPGGLLALSIASIWAMVAVVGFIVIVLLFIGVVTLLQKKKPKWLPSTLRSWKFLPLWMRSLEPYDRVMTKYLLCCKSCKEEQKDEVMQTLPRVGTSFKALIPNSDTSEVSFAVTISSV